MGEKTYRIESAAIEAADRQLMLATLGPLGRFVALADEDGYSTQEICALTRLPARRVTQLVAAARERLGVQKSRSQLSSASLVLGERG